MLKPDECKPGIAVKYAPSPNKTFRGMVARKPWQIGETWVTKLVNMEPAYGRYRFDENKTVVFAAALNCMWPIDAGEGW